MTLKTTYFLISLLALIFSGCQKQKIRGNTTHPLRAGLYQSYNLTYDEENSTLSSTATFSDKPNGIPIVPHSPSRLYFNNEELLPNNAQYIKVAHNISLNSYTEYRWEWFDQNYSYRRNAVSILPIYLHSKVFTWNDEESRDPILELDKNSEYFKVVIDDSDLETPTLSEKTDANATFPDQVTLEFEQTNIDPNLADEEKTTTSKFMSAPAVLSEESELKYTIGIRFRGKSNTLSVYKRTLLFSAEENLTVFGQLNLGNIQARLIRTRTLPIQDQSIYGGKIETRFISKPFKVRVID